MIPSKTIAKNHQESERQKLLLQNELNGLTNRQRAEQTELLKLKNSIRLIEDSLERDKQKIGEHDPAFRQNKRKLEEIDAEIVKMHRDFEAELRKKEAERKLIEGVVNDMSKKLHTDKGSEIADESKLKRMHFELAQKEEDIRKREVLIRNLKQKLNYI